MFERWRIACQSLRVRRITQLMRSNTLHGFDGHTVLGHSLRGVIVGEREAPAPPSNPAVARRPLYHRASFGLRAYVSRPINWSLTAGERLSVLRRLCFGPFRGGSPRPAPPLHVRQSALGWRSVSAASASLADSASAAGLNAARGRRDGFGVPRGELGPGSPPLGGVRRSADRALQNPPLQPTKGRGVFASGGLRRYHRSEPPPARHPSPLSGPLFYGAAGTLPPARPTASSRRSSAASSPPARTSSRRN